MRGIYPRVKPLTEMTTCAIGRSDLPSGRCLRDKEIELVAKVLGTFSASRSGSGSGSGSGAGEREKLYEKTGCKDDKCVLDKAEEMVTKGRFANIFRQYRLRAFKLKGPAEERALLDNFLLARILLQLEANYPHVKAGGVFSCDFMMNPPLTPYAKPQAIVEDWKAERWEKLFFIINIDHRNGFGLHWVGICISSPPKGSGSVSGSGSGYIAYIDSLGDLPPGGKVMGSRPYEGHAKYETSLDRWLNEVRIAFLPLFPMELFINETQYQTDEDNTECGVYASFLCLCLAEGVTPAEFVSRKITKEEIMAQRKKLYEPDPEYYPTPV